MTQAWVVLLLACQFQLSRLQATVDINPQENIPGIGALIGGGDEKPILHRWQFWLGIGLAAAFFIVLVYFVVRGFRNWKKLKEEQADNDEEDQKALEHTIATENNTPPDTTTTAVTDSSPTVRTINVNELARRTGRRKRDLLSSHASGHHHRRTSSMGSETTTSMSMNSETAASAADTVDTL